MSRIGKKPVTVPDGVKVSVAADNTITVQGKSESNPVTSIKMTRQTINTGRLILNEAILI